MKEVLEFLNENQVQYFSTVGLDNKPRVRPFQFMVEKDGKFYYCTSNKKKVYKQLVENPYVEICVSNAKFEWLRISGKVIFDDNMDIKKQIIEKSPIVRKTYKEAGNPELETFYIGEAKAVIADFSGQPPRKFDL